MTTIESQRKSAYFVAAWVALFGWTCPAGLRCDPRPADVGALLPLTGPLADEGVMVKRGLDLALSELTAADPAAAALRIEDSQGDTKTAVSAYRALRARFKPAAVITWGSGIGAALMPLVDQDRVLQVSVAASTPRLSVSDDFTLRLFPSALQEGRFLAERAAPLVGKKRFAVIAADNDYGQGLAESFKTYLQKGGREIAGQELLRVEEKDFVPYLLRLRAKNPEALYVACYAGCAAVVVRRAAEIGMRVPVLASSASVATDDFIAAAGPAGEGLYAVLAGPDYRHPADPAVRSFVDRYRQVYRAEPGPMLILAARGYDALRLIAAAAKRCGGTAGACWRDELLRTKDYRGASGVINFDAAGDMVTAFGLYQVRNGAFEALSPE